MENPFRRGTKWYWTDDVDCVHGPYDTQVYALRAVLTYMAPTRWERFKACVVKLKNWAVAAIYSG